ncbi:unnamed protein product [Phytophthora fragariaefolia]|uniref:Unnamed protein product n=1 Tax=Phytophthora fragariaefolia TaxID=1490495 RepID=A0A9W7DBB6_9STRA|nr:unnamed protein product [Phytophthora fragariaefolia]
MTKDVTRITRTREVRETARGRRDPLPTDRREDKGKDEKRACVATGSGSGGQVERAERGARRATGIGAASRARPRRRSRRDTGSPRRSKDKNQWGRTVIDWGWRARVTGGPSTGDGARTPVSVEDSTNGDGGPAAPVPEASPTGSGPPAANALRDSVAAAGSAVEPCTKGSSVSNSVRSKRQEPQEKEEAGASDPAASGRQKIIVAEQSKAVVAEDAPQTSRQKVERKQTRKDHKDATRGDALEIVEDAEVTHRKALKDFLAMAALAEQLSNWTDAGTVPLHVSSARRRAEKRVLKARAKERRARLALDAQKQASRYPAGTYLNMGEHQRSGGHAQVRTKKEVEDREHELPQATSKVKKHARRKKVTNTYEYRSGSMYEGHGTLLDKETGKEVQVGKLRAVQAPAMDLLPTAMMRIRGQRRPVKLDTGAQYCVAGRQWQALGSKLDKPAPVDYIEGFGGAPVAVLGVWRFEFESQYQQPVRVDALVVAHDTEDFLIGEDLDRDRVAAWLETLSTLTTTLSNEDELEIGEMEVKDRDLMLALLRSYPSLLEPKHGCPPATTLGVVHHINTGSAPPIKVRPRRHSRAEHETIDSEVEAMLHDGVIEYGTGVWGFLVVLVRKKDGITKN